MLFPEHGRPHVYHREVLHFLGYTGVPIAVTGLCRYLTLFLAHIVNCGPNTNNLWASVSSSIRPRIFKVSRDGLYMRYRHVFPKNYTKHAYIIEALYIAFFYKDLSFLSTLLNELFSSVNFFKHRFLIYFLRAALRSFALGRQTVGAVRGLYIKFRGKIAQAGNSRRRSFLIGCGEISTNYANNYRVNKFQIKTFTGAIGCTVILAWE